MDVCGKTGEFQIRSVVQVKALAVVNFLFQTTALRFYKMFTEGEGRRYTGALYTGFATFL